MSSENLLRNSLILFTISLNGCGLELDHKISDETHDVIRTTGEGLSDVAKEVGEGLDATSTEVGGGLTSVGEGIGQTGEGLAGVGEGLAGLGEGISQTGEGLEGLGKGINQTGEGLSDLGVGMEGIGKGMVGVGSGMADISQVLARLTAGFEAGMTTLGSQLRAGMENTSHNLNNQMNANINTVSEILHNFQKNPPKFDININHGLEKIIDSAGNQIDENLDRILTASTQALISSGELSDKSIEVAKKEFYESYALFNELILPNKKFDESSGLLGLKSQIYKIHAMFDYSMTANNKLLERLYPENFSEYVSSVLSFSKSGYTTLKPIHEALTQQIQLILEEGYRDDQSQELLSTLSVELPEINIKPLSRSIQQVQSKSLNEAYTEIENYMGGIDKIINTFEKTRLSLKEAFENKEDWIKTALKHPNQFKRLGSSIMQFKNILTQLFLMIRSRIEPIQKDLIAEIERRSLKERDYYTRAWEYRVELYLYQEKLKHSFAIIQLYLKAHELDENPPIYVDQLKTTLIDTVQVMGDKLTKIGQFIKSNMIPFLDSAKCLNCIPSQLSEFDKIKSKALESFYKLKKQVDYILAIEKLLQEGDLPKDRINQLLVGDNYSIAAIISSLQNAKDSLEIVYVMSFRVVDQKSKDGYTNLFYFQSYLEAVFMNFVSTIASIERHMKESWEPLVISMQQGQGRTLQSIKLTGAVAPKWFSNMPVFFKPQTQSLKSIEMGHIKNLMVLSSDSGKSTYYLPITLKTSQKTIKGQFEMSDMHAYPKIVERVNKINSNPLTTKYVVFYIEESNINKVFDIILFPN